MNDVLKVVELHDDDVILSILNRDRVWAAYALTDLDPPYRADVRFVGTLREGTPTSLVLLFEPPGLSAVLPYGDPDGVRQILSTLRDLPRLIFLISHDDHIGAIEERYAVSDRWVMLRMAMRKGELVTPLPSDITLERLKSVDAPELRAIYNSVRESFFHPSLLDHGVFVAVRDAGRIVAVAGTHTFSAHRRIGTVGGVYTDPGFRGRGLAKATTGAVAAAMFDMGADLVALNVREDNLPAVAAYRRLGFRAHNPFWEGHAELR